MKRASAGTFRILIVDDNEAIHNDLKKILVPPQDTSAMADDEAVLFGSRSGQGAEFQIDSAFQGEEGFEKVKDALAQESPYAMAFVDIRMPPGWDGIETIAHLWSSDPELQIVICTAYSDYNWQDIAERLGLSPNLVILRKPFDPIEVTQLAHALTAKWQNSKQIKLQMAELDRMVAERTIELMSTVKELEQAKQKAETDAFEDSLTKLPNRRYFLRRLTQALEYARSQTRYQCAVLYLDVDRFKVINDSLGHLVGDEMLVEVARRMRAWLREGNGRSANEDVVARIGGDEFAILLDGIREPNDAVRISERVREALSKPFTVLGREMVCAASIGIVTSNGSYADSEGMMRDADTAMYRAKAAGGSTYVLFDESMHRDNLDRLHKEQEIRQAIERNEFLIAYQPIVSLRSRNVEGSEALIRWQSPSRGLVAPIDFIPLSEETGLIVPIGAWSLREACRQVQQWYAGFGAASTPPVSVNISARQFLQPDLVRTIEEAIRESGIESRSIRLELTETVTMHDPKRAARMFRQLQGLGIRLSIDDFGTGYSSLNYLHSFSVDTLKIDKSFVSNMENDERSLSIVKTIISLAHNLGMKVVAEGVETLGQLEMLRELDCDSAQGYYFSRPVAAASFEELVTARIAPQASAIVSL
ncbi:MAG TPA: EAL domain-containing protein [Terracidiphilus sp.]|nr:EAL domain-containing protein [Terracidiphilus sp.]